VAVAEMPSMLVVVSLWNNHYFGPNAALIDSLSVMAMRMMFLRHLDYWIY
jgi:hypothetical protein